MTKPASPPVCTDCLHFKHAEPYIASYCALREVEDVDPVNGQVVRWGGSDPYAERRDGPGAKLGWRCGPSGSFFLPKP